MQKNMRRTRIAEVEENRFYQLPKFLVHEEQFNKLNGDAKILYTIMRERLELSIKNNWVNKDGEVYIIYKREDMMKDVNKSNKTVGEYVKALKKYGLIEEEQQGLNKPNLIYVCTLDIEAQWKCKNYTSGSVKTTPQEVKNLHANDTDLIDTDITDTKIVYKDDDIEKPSKIKKQSSSSQPVSKEFIEQLKAKWLEVMEEELIIEQELMPKLARLVKKHGEEKVINALNHVYNSDYLQNILDLEHFITLFNRICSHKYDNHVEKKVSAAAHTETGAVSAKVQKFNNMYSHDWDFDEIEKLERAYIERKLASDTNPDLSQNPNLYQ